MNSARQRNMFLSAVMLWVLTGCATGPDVNTQYDRSFDFSKVGTFSAGIAKSWGNAITESMVKNAIESELRARGLQPAGVGAADITVLIHGTTEKRETLETLYSGMGGWGRRGMAGGAGIATTTGYKYTEGTLIVDIFDTKTQTLIWRGTAVDELKKKQEAQEEQMKKAAKKLFADFPPGRSP